MTSRPPRIIPVLEYFKQNKNDFRPHHHPHKLNVINISAVPGVNNNKNNNAMTNNNNNNNKNKSNISDPILIKLLMEGFWDKTTTKKTSSSSSTTTKQNKYILAITDPILTKIEIITITTETT